MLKVADTAKFTKFTSELLELLLGINNAALQLGTDVTITGAQGPEYPEGKVHNEGYAVDLRVWDQDNPAKLADLIRDKISYLVHTKILFGDEAHTDHIHVGFAPAFSIERARTTTRKSVEHHNGVN